MKRKKKSRNLMCQQGRRIEIESSRPAGQLGKTLSQNKILKRAEQLPSKCIGPEFKFQFHQNK
jgi:hypothetical protein